jgi:hypothetical protein
MENTVHFIPSIQLSLATRKKLSAPDGAEPPYTEMKNGCDACGRLTGGNALEADDVDPLDDGQRYANQKKKKRSSGEQGNCSE